VDEVKREEGGRKGEEGVGMEILVFSWYKYIWNVSKRLFITFGIGA